MPFPTPAFLPPSGTDIPAGVQALQVVATNVLQKAYTAAVPVWPEFAQELKFSSAGKMILFAVDRTWDLALWVGVPKAQDIVVREIDVVVQPYTQPVAIDAFTWQDDHIGAYAGLFEVMGCNMAMFPDKLLASAMFNAQTTAWYDGANFYSTSHPVNPEYPSLYGTQSNLFTGTNLTWSNYAYKIQPALDGMLAANGRPWMQGAGRKRKLVVTPADTVNAKTILKSQVVPTSILQGDGTTYGTAATSNQLTGAAEVVEMVDLVPFIADAGANRPYFLHETSLAPFSPFGIGLREAFSIIPIISVTDPLFREQHKFQWQPWGRLAAVPTVYQSTVMGITAA